jgi:dTDP-4-dehydrorhamnose reductase
VLARTRTELDISDAEAVQHAVRTLRPDVIINAAAFTAVDRCEAERVEAFRVNADGPARLADAAQSVGARMLHISTDYVFDGTKTTPYVESDATNPRSVYGTSKLAGEQAVLAIGDLGTVVRTAWVFGRHGTNMVKTVLRARTTTPVLRFVDDQRGSPTSAGDLTGLLLGLVDTPLPGVVHGANAGAVSWYEFVCEILRQCGDDPGRVVPIATADLDPPRPVPRPANSVLVSERLAEAGIAPLRAYELALADVLAALAG